MHANMTDCALVNRQCDHQSLQQLQNTALGVQNTIEPQYTDGTDKARAPHARDQEEQKVLKSSHHLHPRDKQR